jgi:hypothetical protein
VLGTAFRAMTDGRTTIHGRLRCMREETGEAATYSRTVGKRRAGRRSYQIARPTVPSSSRGFDIQWCSMYYCRLITIRWQFGIAITTSFLPLFCLTNRAVILNGISVFRNDFPGIKSKEFGVKLISKTTVYSGLYHSDCKRRGDSDCSRATAHHGRSFPVSVFKR